MGSTVDVEVTGGILTTLDRVGVAGRGKISCSLAPSWSTVRVATDLGIGTAPSPDAIAWRISTADGVAPSGPVAPMLSARRACLLALACLRGIFSLSERHQTRQWKSPTVGEDVSEVTAQPYAVPSENLRPWTPGTPLARKLLDGAWRLTWYGRARFTGEWVDLEEATPDSTSSSIACRSSVARTDHRAASV